MSLTTDAQVLGERRRRVALWEALQSRPESLYPAMLLNELRVFYGGRGVWVHLEKTRGIGGSLAGVTVGLMHTGSSYADDLDDDGVIYHYPSTDVKGRDVAEIEATKAAMRLRLPVFVISYPRRKARTRKVDLGWVDGFDDERAWFLVSFFKQQQVVFPAAEDSAFSAYGLRAHKLTTVKRRTGQQRFKFEVFRRYGGQCAVCDVTAPPLLDAAHIVPFGNGGTDDPRNGLVLCANHHRAFDRHLFVIEPETLEIQVAADCASAALGLTKEDLRHLRLPPHTDALIARRDIERS